MFYDFAISHALQHTLSIRSILSVSFFFFVSPSINWAGLQKRAYILLFF